MKPNQIITALIVSGLAVHFEFRSRKELTLFFDWVNSIPFIMLCVLATVFLILNIRRYVSLSVATSFLPAFICLMSIILVLWHSQRRTILDNSPTSFTATTYQIGNDGGFVLDFKKNGHLKAERRDHWAVTYYWGKYYRVEDTIKLDIPFNFNLAPQAILTDTSLHIIGDTIMFEVVKSAP